MRVYGCDGMNEEPLTHGDMHIEVVLTSVVITAFMTVQRSVRVVEVPT